MLQYPTLHKKPQINTKGHDMGLRKLIRKTSWYKNYQAKKESKMSDEEYFIYRHKKIFGYTLEF